MCVFLDDHYGLHKTHYAQQHHPFVDDKLVLILQVVVVGMHWKKQLSRQKVHQYQTNLFERQISNFDQWHWLNSNESEQYWKRTITAVCGTTIPIRCCWGMDTVQRIVVEGSTIAQPNVVMQLHCSGVYTDKVHSIRWVWVKMNTTKGRTCNKGWIMCFTRLCW